MDTAINMLKEIHASSKTIDRQLKLNKCQKRLLSTNKRINIIPNRPSKDNSRIVPNKCKWNECGNEARLKSPFCSQACKKRHSRSSGTDQPCEVVQIASGTEVVHVEESELSYENYLKYQPLGMYATRTNPDLLNYGKPMTPHQLEKAGLKANRVPIPGDWDYKGVCKQVVGQWVC